jgi:putative tricarboxylic transport membrane protein
MVDRLFAGVWLALTLGFAAIARTYEAQFSYEPIGPRAFPLMLAGISAVCALWLLLRPKRIAEALPPLPEGGVTRAAVLMIGLFAYAFLFEWVGFPLATVLATVVIGRLFGGSWLGATVAGVALGVSLFVLFDKILDVTLPLGALWRS